MTLPIILGERILVRMWTSILGQAAVNSFSYKVTALTGTVSDLTVATAFDVIFGAIPDGIKPMMGNAAFYNGVQLYLVDRVPMPLPIHASTHAGFGTGGIDLMAPQATGITSWYSAFTGPKNRGRTYWPFPALPFGDVNGVPTNAYLLAMEQLAGLISPIVTIGAGANTADLQHVIHQRSPAGNVDIASHTNQRKWATQKKRGNYGRSNTSPF
jgi:hypothetical protein